MTSGHFLRTRRLGFRIWSEADITLAAALWGDPAVTRLIGGPFTQMQIQQRLAREIAQQATDGVQYWPMFLPEFDEFVGCCGLRRYPDGDCVFELGFHLLPLFWGCGLAKEAADAVIGHAFDVLGAASLFAAHHPQNACSARLLERLGFRYDRDEFYAPTGLEHPSYSLQSHTRAREA